MKQKSHKHSIDKIKFQGNPLSLVHHFWPSISRLSPGLSHMELSWASGFVQGHFQKPHGGEGTMRGQVPPMGTWSSYCYRASDRCDTGTGLSPWLWAFPRDPRDPRSWCSTEKAQQKQQDTEHSPPCQSDRTFTL